MRKVPYINWTMTYGPWTNLILKFDSRQLRHYENLHHKFPFLSCYMFDYRYSKTDFVESEIIFKLDPATPRPVIKKLTNLLKRRKSLKYIGLTK